MVHNNISGSFEDFYAGIEWLIGEGVNVINASMTLPQQPEYYNDYSEWVDHIAIMHDVHFVVSAGNNGDEGYIRPPASSNNAITVGGFKINGSANIDTLTMLADSAYKEPSAI